MAQLNSISALSLVATALIWSLGLVTSASAHHPVQRSTVPAGNKADTSMQALESGMSGSFAQLGDMMHGAIKTKTNLIKSKAEAGMQAGSQLGSMMQNGLKGMSARSSGMMSDASSLMGSMGDTMMKGSSKLHSQLKQSMDGHMSRMQSMHGMGDQMMNQAKQLGQTMTEGLTGTMEHLHRTGQKMVSQLQSGHHKNTQAMSGIFGSMQDSVGKFGKNMGGNMGDVMGHAQQAAQQVAEHLHKVASAPMNMLQSLMQSKGGSHSSGGGGRY